MVNNVITLSTVYFPHTFFMIEIADTEYLNLDLSQKVPLCFRVNGEVLPYGLSTQMQTLERVYNSKVKLQMFGEQIVRFIFDESGEIVRYVPIAMREGVSISEICTKVMIHMDYNLNKLKKVKLNIFNSLQEKLESYRSLFDRSMKQASWVKFWMAFYGLGYHIIPEKYKADFLLASPNMRFHLFVSFLSYTVENIIVEQKVQLKLTKRLESQQKEFVLHERIKALSQELNKGGKVGSFEEKWKLGPEYWRKNFKKELEELQSLNRNSPEYSQQQRLLEYLGSLPWTTGEGVKNLENMERFLDQQHYGMLNVKDAIMDYVYSYRQNPANSRAICLVGDPGVGKTSVAKGLAKVLNKEFIKISLAGCSESSYLLGSSRVYVNSQPGILVRTISRLNNNDPVILLDEIDKTVNRYSQGSGVEYALLDILDKENNVRFRDHFIEEEYSLQNVLFICTANSLERVPAPLRDRLMIIHVEIYSPDEKVQIAKNFLMPKIQGNLNMRKVNITDDVLLELIERYTWEGGVRQLEKRLDKLFISMLRGKVRKIDLPAVRTLLARFYFPTDTGTSRATFDLSPGRALGMYVGIGGGICAFNLEFFKVGEKPKDGLPQIVVTGSVSKVLSDSVQAAFLAVIDLLDRRGKKDLIGRMLHFTRIHMHSVPSASYKDGPSAGLALAMAILSYLLDKTLPYWAFTGEISSRGEVMMIGGVKAKSYGAKFAHVERILLPRANENEFKLSLVDIDHNFVDSLDEAVELVWPGLF